MASAVGRLPPSGLERGSGKGRSPTLVLEPPSARGGRRRSFFFDGIAKATRRSTGKPKRTRGEGASARSLATAPTVSTDASSVNPRESYESDEEEVLPIPNSVDEEAESNGGDAKKVEFEAQPYDEIVFDPADELPSKQEDVTLEEEPDPAEGDPAEEEEEAEEEKTADKNDVKAPIPAEPQPQKESEELKSDEGNLLEGKKVAVFNANTPEGTSIVRSLAKKRNEVVAIVRVFTSKNVRGLFRTEGVTITVADSRHDTEAIVKALQGCDRVFMVMKFWEKFDGILEEQQARTVFEACNKAGVKNVVFSTFEDVRKLRERGQRSQVLPGENGKIEPTFAGMRGAIDYAKSLNVRVTHMITSYLDQERSKNSLCLIKGAGKLIISSQFEKDEET